ncbi:hypothetical protein [Salipiger mangrovisoli]|uniref:Type II secretion system protein GspF domain-containing protein n=1 Tax=Salipiger mangrovisoli TaxID=2865933 RepID=A0ABR9X6N0_9RHOB|nr:hypothetical protein [Salipiger mangrovisoli]MBE9639270.1 hypothetical protein [Salipiger mangrovisoli]
MTATENLTSLFENILQFLLKHATEIGILLDIVGFAFLAVYLVVDNRAKQVSRLDASLQFLFEQLGPRHKEHWPIARETMGISLKDHLLVERFCGIFAKFQPNVSQVALEVMDLRRRFGDSRGGPDPIMKGRFKVVEQVDWVILQDTRTITPEALEHLLEMREWLGRAQFRYSSPQRHIWLPILLILFGYGFQLLGTVY